MKAVLDALHSYIPRLFAFGVTEAKGFAWSPGSVANVLSLWTHDQVPWQRGRHRCKVSRWIQGWHTSCFIVSPCLKSSEAGYCQQKGAVRHCERLQFEVN